MISSCSLIPAANMHITCSHFTRLLHSLWLGIRFEEKRCRCIKVTKGKLSKIVKICDKDFWILYSQGSTCTSRLTFYRRSWNGHLCLVMCFSSMLQALTLNSVNNFPALLYLYEGFLPQESSYSISGELMLFYCIYRLYLVRVQAPAVLNLSLCVFRTISLSIRFSVCPLLNVGLLVFLTWNVFFCDCNKLMWSMWN